MTLQCLAIMTVGRISTTIKSSASIPISIVWNSTWAMQCSPSNVAEASIQPFASIAAMKGQDIVADIETNFPT
jgi:hypothetical protein